MKLSNETLIGIFVVVVLLGLGVITWKAGNYDFTPEGYELKVQFKNIDGVEENAPVTLNGFEVGRVKDIQILYGDATRVELTLWLDAKAKIHKGSKAFVKNMGFLGEKYVGLTTGDDGEEFLAPGTVLVGQEPTSLDKILVEGEVIAANLKEISAEVNERLKVNRDNIDEILANMRASMKNLSSISDNVNERLQVNKNLIDDTMVHLNGASKNLEEMSYDLKLNPWKLMYKPKKNREENISP